MNASAVRASEARQRRVALAEAADLARGLHHGVAERDLAVAPYDDDYGVRHGGTKRWLEGDSTWAITGGIRRIKGSRTIPKCGQRM